MKTITFECEVITPMFLAGADGKTPELRPPSIKGAMRFWWRAMNAGRFNSINDLKEAESKIFGGGGENAGRSKLIIWISKQPDYIEGNDKSYLLPHKNGNSKGELPCIVEGRSFIFHLKLEQSIRISNNYTFDSEELIKLVTTISYLGGLGKGARRGFGSFKIIKCLEDELEKMTPELNFNNLIQNSNLNYPFILNIDIGKKPITVKEIREVSHKIHKKDYDFALEISKQNDNTYTDRRGNERPNKRYLNYPSSLGDGANRFASPIYVSVIKKEDGKLYPIVTTLKSVPPNNRRFDKNIQDEFIKAILQ